MNSVQKQLIIIGAGSVGGHIATNLHLYFKEDIEVLFLDDDNSKIGRNFCDAKVVGNINTITKYPKDIMVVVGIAFPKIKRKIISKLITKGYNNFPSLISTKAWISNNVKIGKGVIIYPGCTINYATQIDDYVVMNMNCAIGHNCIIDKFSSMSPSVSLGGFTVIKENVELGIGSQTLQNLTIGTNSIIAAGAAVTKSIPSNCTAVGIPAKPIK